MGSISLRGATEVAAASYHQWPAVWKPVMVLVFVAIGAGAVLWFGRSPPRGDPRLAPKDVRHVDKEMTGGLARPAHEPESERAPVAAIDPTEAQVERSSAADAANSPSRGDLTLAGRIAVIDELGQTHAVEDGSFVLFLWQGGTGEGHDVEVHGGRWSTIIPTDAPLAGLSVDNVRLGERGAVVSGGLDERFPVPESGWLEIAACWPKRTLLQVYDRATGRELAPVLLVEVDEWPERELGHPGERATRARDLGPSPVELAMSGFPDQRSLFVRSPGYAWARIEIDETRGGDRFVLLDPACELAVEVVGEAHDPGAKLRLFGTAYSPLFEQELRDATTTIVEALPPGKYRVAAQIGDYWRDPLVLGETTVELVTSRRTHATLALEEWVELIDVPFAGTLIVPTEWGLERFQLEFELLDPSLGSRDSRMTSESGSMTRDAPERYRWSVGMVQAGRYEVRLGELGYSVVLEVSVTGSMDHRIEVPPPCEILVSCVDEETGLEITKQRVSWHCAVPAGVRAWSNEDAIWDAASRRWRIRAPIGPVLLQTTGDDYVNVYNTVEAGAGQNEVCLRLARLTGLELVLRDGETELPWIEDMEATLDPLEGQEAYLSSRLGDGTFTFLRKTPGNYELRVAPIAGYAKIAPTVVRLEKGVVTRHVVELVRQR